MTFDELIFPRVQSRNWQMMPWEQIAMTGLLSRIRPKGALEIGIYHGGSLTLTSQYAESIIAIDIDPEVTTRFEPMSNVDVLIGPSSVNIQTAFDSFRQRSIPLNFVLIDADHTTEGVKRDIELVLDYQVSEPMVILMHDSGHDETRKGIREADWQKNDAVDFVDLDFVPGQIIEQGVSIGRYEIWGGFALAYLNPDKRGEFQGVREAARTSIDVLKNYCNDTVLRSGKIM